MGRPALARLAGLALVVGLLTIAAADPLAGPTQARTAPVAERTFARIAALSGPSSVRLLSIGAPSDTPTIEDGPDLQIPAQPETPPHPEVVRFRPFDRAVQVRPDAPLSVRFTQPMDHASTQAALRVSGLDLTRGRFRWAENDTVLVFTPSVRLAYGKRYTMSLGSIARSAEGMPVDAAAAGAESSFTVMPKPKPKPAPTKAQALRLATGSRWASPLRGPITQYFGQRLTRYGIHRGIDIDGNTGDPVRAAATGTVIAAGWVDPCSGIAVGLDHGSGLSSWYRHLSSVGVRVGRRVSVGSIIGRVGNTGCSLGSHLHFAIRRGDTYLDPLRYVPRW